MTTLLLTNRLKMNFELISFAVWASILSIICIGSCSHTNHQTDIPDVAYKARAFQPYTVGGDPNGGVPTFGKLDLDTTKYPLQLKFTQFYLKKLDTLDMVIGNYLGHSMTVDQAEQIKQIFFRITRELRNDTAHGR